MKRSDISSTYNALAVLLAAAAAGLAAGGASLAQGTQPSPKVQGKVVEAPRQLPSSSAAGTRAVTNDTLSGKAIIIVGGKDKAPPAFEPGPVVISPQPILRDTLRAGDETRLNPQPLPPKEIPQAVRKLQP